MRALLAARPAAQTLLAGLLRARGWDVCMAEGAEAAVEAFAREPCALVVLDEELPAQGGIECCRGLRASPVGRAAYVVLLARDGGPGAVRRFLDAGADDFLLHPLEATTAEGRIAFAERHLVTERVGPAPRPRAGSYPQRLGQLEETMRVQRAWLEELLDSAPEGVAVVDEEDRVLRINREFSNMFGYPPAEAVGRPINELIVPEHLHEEGLRLTRGVVQGERITVDTVRRHRNGRLIEVSVLATPIRVSGGPIGAYGIYRDITDRKEQERALRASEARYRALFDQSPVGVFLCDADLRIVQCNERLPEILRATEEEIVGSDLHNLADERVQEAVARAGRGLPTMYEGPYQTLRPGLQLWVSVRYAPLRDDEGRIVGGIAAVEDVTEREEVQQQLRAQTAELERVNAALQERTLELEAAMQTRGRLYTAINHELRTPISAVMLYQELLLSGAIGELSADQTEALKHSHGAAEHLLDLVRDVLDLSKLEAGHVRVQPTAVDVGELLSDLRATVLPLAQRYGSTIVLELEEEPRRIVTDPQRLRQILLNLLSNAAKFGRGRPIRLRVRAASAGEAAIEVVDRGIGISAEDLPRIWEDFVQVGVSQDGGTGLGLAISRRLAQLLDGRLEVESEPDAGSTFRLVLPYGAAGAPPGPPSPGA